MVTTEVALALPAVALVLVAALSVVSVLSTRATCADAARHAARAAARGETDSVVREVAHATGRGVSAVEVSRRPGGLVTVRVTARPSAWSARLPVPDVTAEATAHDEASADEAVIDEAVVDERVTEGVT